MKYTLPLIFAFFSITQYVSAQILGYDTLKVMQYNLMMFNGPGINCTPPDPNVRTGYISTIFNYEKPDVFGVNEMYPSAASADLILNNSINVNGTNYYKRAPFISESGDITNMIFYNSKKLIIQNSTIVGCSPRHANVYTFNHVGTAPGIVGKSVNTSLTFVVVHLKASNGTAEATERGTCAQNIMNFVNGNYIKNGNYFVMGDFNLYTNTEPAFQNFISTTSGISFNDPANKVGSWSNNNTFTSVHSQSTHLGTSGCFSSGGNDDRFDFILCNKVVLNGSQFVKYIDQSYKVTGQSGTIFNKDVNDPSNTSAPTEVLNALFGNSDHMPVSLKLRIALSTLTSDLTNNDYSTIPSPFTADYIYSNPNITLTGFYNKVIGVATFSGNSIIVKGENTYTTAFGTSLNAVTFSGTFSTNNGKMTINISSFTKSDSSPIVSDPSLLPALIEGAANVNNSNIAITTASNTISGTYSFANPEMTIVGTNQYYNADQTIGMNYVTIVGLTTFTGNNIAISPTNTIYSTTAGINTGNSALAKSLVFNIINPFGEVLTLQNLENGNNEMFIYDLFGRVQMAQTFEVGNQKSITIPTNEIISGTYILAIRTGNQSFTFKKIVKQ